MDGGNPANLAPPFIPHTVGITTNMGAPKWCKVLPYPPRVLGSKGIQGRTIFSKVPPAGGDPHPVIVVYWVGPWDV